MIADIPAGFDKWEWSEMPISQNATATAYFYKVLMFQTGVLLKISIPTVQPLMEILDLSNWKTTGLSSKEMMVHGF